MTIQEGAQTMFNEWNNFIRWELLSRDTIDVKRVYVDITDDLIAGILLSQIIYYNLPSKKSNKITKLTLKKDGFYWLAKKRTDWWEECRISPKQFDRALKILEEKQLVATKLFKFNGTPLKHIRINIDVLLTMMQVQENGLCPKGKVDFDQRGKSLTKTTTKTTFKNTLCCDFSKRLSQTKKSQPSAFCFEISKAIISKTRSLKKIKVSNHKITTGAKVIRLLMKMDLPGSEQEKEKRIRKVLTWLMENYDGKFTPVVESASAFRKKFLAIENQMKRKQDVPVKEFKQPCGEVTTESFSDLGIVVSKSSGYENTRCPNCSKQNSTEKTLEVNITEGAWWCSECGWLGTLKTKPIYR